MKRCPKCRRSYTDESLNFCLDDGAVLVDGPALVHGSVPPPGQPSTALLSEPHLFENDRSGGENPTRRFIDRTAGAQKQSDESTEAQTFATRRTSMLLIVLGVTLVLLVGAFSAYRYFKPSQIGTINSIAVLPFENKSSDAETDYLSDGLAESLIYRLSQLPDLKVSPTSSVFRYKGKDTDPEAVAKELGVDSVLTGRISQRGDNLTISVNLVDTRNGKSLWGDQYERNISELLQTQKEIASEITRNLKFRLSGDSEQKLAKRYTDNNEAYQLYLKGQYHYAKRTKEDVLKGIGYFEQAIQIDPKFALAYVAISDSYASMPAYPYLSPKEAFPKAKDAAQKALEIDPSLAEAHTALAFCLTNYDWNWAEAERHFKLSIELDPDLSFSHSRYGWLYLSPIGRSDEAIAEIREALELEPLNLLAGALLAQTYMYARQDEQALEQARKTYDLDKTFVLGRYSLGRAYIAKGMYGEAITISQETLQADPTSQFALLVLGNAYARSDQRREAENVIQKFRELSKTQYVAPYYVATIYAALGDKEQAFAELEMAYYEHDWLLPRLKVDPLMDSLREDPRYKDLLKRLNLPE